MRDYKVSVIIPIYNQENYLDISLHTVIGQRYSNLEILLVNDGSTDNSSEIIDKYAKNDSRIVVINKNNGGLVDAVLCGINRATGDYIAFLDPDDRIGEDFIENFIENLDMDYDFVASGFFYNKRGAISPFYLNDDHVFDRLEIEKLRYNFLIGHSILSVSNTLFMSRWNKIYKSECIKKIIDDYGKCSDVSLGEDTLFTFLVLKYCNIGKTTKALNSYYYNVANSDSMMQSGAQRVYVENVRKAFNQYNKISDSKNNEQGYYLYYYLIESLLNKNINSNQDAFNELYEYVQSDEIYRKTLHLLLKKCHSLKERMIVSSRILIKKPNTYMLLFQNAKLMKEKVRNICQDSIFLISNIWRRNICSIANELRFRKNRRNAFRDIRNKLPEIEKKTQEIFLKHAGEISDLGQCTLERNVFVFWWDGFDKAPEIVKACFKSVKRHFSDCRVVQITKDNFKDYTDIDAVIVNDFLAGKISVQSFSDVLRFNLLKNNGGIWIDATIYFSQKYNLLDTLTDKSIESLNFATSADFLKYDDITCSWSSYIFASRKNSVFVRVVDEVFQSYYLEYKTFTMYFFMDALLMLCKKYGIDNSALDKIHYNSHDMMLLSNVLAESVDTACMKEIDKIPQKLSWFWNGRNIKEDSFYNFYIKNGSL